MSDSVFQGVADTLYIPLTARIYVSKRFPQYFYDPKALELESAIPGASIAEKSNEYQMIASVARYYNLDEMVLAYGAQHASACNIVNLGCGLETMWWRLHDKLPQARFYDMDLPEVIATRQRVLGEAPTETLIAGDLFDMAWAEAVDKSLPTLLIVSGVFQYFHNEEVLGFIARAKAFFADGELIFDATNSKGIKYTNKYVQKTGNNSAMMYCAIDDVPAFAREAKCELLEHRPFFVATRKMLKGKVGIYSKVAMWVTDHSNRAFLVHLKL
ncbi:MAG: class I SAM-dependent methyltransferase [Coriobacteriales bacterium]|nr:class I SAM-dependent methyltransferase [Coriobacteriales bacterium]